MNRTCNGPRKNKANFPRRGTEAVSGYGGGTRGNHAEQSQTWAGWGYSERGR
jgi:hypothetical protein